MEYSSVLPWICQTKTIIVNTSLIFLFSTCALICSSNTIQSIEQKFHVYDHIFNVKCYIYLVCINCCSSGEFPSRSSWDHMGFSHYMLPTCSPLRKSRTAPQLMRSPALGSIGNTWASSCHNYLVNLMTCNFFFYFSLVLLISLACSSLAVSFKTVIIVYWTIIVSGSSKIQTLCHLTQVLLKLRFTAMERISGY